MLPFTVKLEPNNNNNRGGRLDNLPGLGYVLKRMRSSEDRARCEDQLAVVTDKIEEYFLRR